MSPLEAQPEPTTFCKTLHIELHFFQSIRFRKSSSAESHRSSLHSSPCQNPRETSKVCSSIPSNNRLFHRSKTNTMILIPILIVLYNRSYTFKDNEKGKRPQRSDY